MKKYTLGFAFIPKVELMVMIHKNRGPRGVKGLWNGLGGKLEEGETLHECMTREFQEECGLYIPEEDWSHFATFGDGETWEVYCFKTVLPEGHANPQTMEDEEVDYQAVWDDVVLNECITTSRHFKYLTLLAKDSRLVNPPPYFRFNF